MFENIRPEDFFRETSAVEQQTVPEKVKALLLHTSEVGFEAFLESRLGDCRAESSRSGDVAPHAWLASSDVHRKFVGEDDETPGDFARRLQREAEQMGAHWSFVAMVSPARVILPGQTAPPDIDSDDTDAVNAALESGELSLGVCWTAASKTSGEVVVRGGIIYLDDHGHPLGEVQGDMDEDLDDPFTEVLR